MFILQFSTFQGPGRAVVGVTGRAGTVVAGAAAGGTRTRNGRVGRAVAIPKQVVPSTTSKKLEFSM